MSIPVADIFEKLRALKDPIERAHWYLVLAEREYTSGLETASSEARQWSRLAEECHKNDLARQLAELQEKFGLKSKNREAADRLRGRKVAGSNIVSFPSKDGI